MKSRVRQFGVNLIRKTTNLIVNFYYAAAFLSQYKKTSPLRPLEQMKKVLLINLSKIGDVIQTTPAIRAIKKDYPHLHLSMIINSQAKEILIGNPYIDRIITYDDRSWHDFLRILKEIRTENFDLSILFFGRIKGSLLALLSGAKNYTGFLNNNLYEIKKFGLQLVPARMMLNKKESLAKRHLNVIEFIGCNHTDTNLEIFLKEEEKRYADELLLNCGISRGDLVVCFNPDTHWECKKWSEGKFAKFGDRLHEIYGAKIVISGSSGGVKAAQRIAFLMENNPIILAGKTTIKQLAAVLKRCDLLITVDSAPLHIAHAAGTPTIALFGPTEYQVVLSQKEKNIAIWKNLSCSPCYNGLHKPLCNNFKCMDSITVDDVLAAMQAQFKKEDVGVIDKLVLSG